MLRIQKKIKRSTLPCDSQMHCILVVLLLAILPTSCSVERFVGNDELFLKETKVVSANQKATKSLMLDDYILQTPNSKWFGAKIPLKLYCLGGVDTTNWATRLLRKIGQDPVIYNPEKAERTIQDLRQVLYNEGYMHNEIQLAKDIKGKKVTVSYLVDPGTQFTIRNIERKVEDPVLRQLLCHEDTLNSLLQQNIRLHLDNDRSDPRPHKQYRIGTLNYFVDTNGITDTLKLNKVEHKGSNIYYGERLRFRPNLLTSNTLFHTGDLYNEEYQKLTYRYLTRLQALSYSNIIFEELEDSIIPTLNCNVVVNHAASKSISFDLEGTNSAGDLGIAASTSFHHKNLFRGSESLTVKLRGAYEAITGLEGYDGHNYIEWGGEATLGFPGFLLPIVSKRFGATHGSTSEISLQYNMQNRPEFNRRVLTAAWRYRWNNQNQKGEE